MTTEGSKERLREHNEEEEKKVLQDLAQGLERMFVKQNECITKRRAKLSSLKAKTDFKKQ